MSQQQKELIAELAQINEEIVDILDSYGRNIARIHQKAVSTLANLPAFNHTAQYGWVHACGGPNTFFREVRPDGLHHTSGFHSEDPRKKLQDMLQYCVNAQLLLPALKGTLSSRIFYDKSGCDTKVIEHLTQDIAARKKIRHLFKQQLAVLDGTSKQIVKASLKGDIWKTGYNTQYSYRGNPWTIAAKVLGRLFFFCTVIGIPMALDMWKSIKYEDNFLSTSYLGAGGEIATAYKGDFDVLYEDSLALFENHDKLVTTDPEEFQPSAQCRAY